MTISNLMENDHSTDSGTNDEGAGQPAQPQAEDIKALVQESVVASLSQIAATMPAPQAGQPAMSSALEAEVQNLIMSGIPAGAITNFLRLQRAADADKSRKEQGKEQERALRAYNEGLWQDAYNALDEIGAKIPFVAKGGEGLKADLLEKMHKHVQSSRECKDIRDSIDSFRKVSTTRLKEVAAKMIDETRTEFGIDKPAGGLDLTSSKPAKNEDFAFDLSKLSKQQRMIYNLNLKHFGDEKKARQRALET